LVCRAGERDPPGVAPRDGATPMATATSKKVQRGFDVACPYCGEEGSVRIYVHDVTEFSCGNCDAEWDAAKLRDLFARWEKLLKWVETAPVVGD